MQVTGCIPRAGASPSSLPYLLCLHRLVIRYGGYSEGYAVKGYTGYARDQSDAQFVDLLIYKIALENQF